VTVVLHGQLEEERYGHLCSRSAITQPDIPIPTVNENRPEVPTQCPKDDASDFVALTPEELFDYLIAVEDPYTCINRILYGYHTDHSPIIFSDTNVNYVAQHAQAIADDFDGLTDNGVHAIFTYLSIAGLFETFYGTNITYTEDTWDKIQATCRTFAANKDAVSEAPVSYFTMGHMFFAASFEGIGSDSTIVALANAYMEGLAADSYTTIGGDLYAYYYCYYYILDVYFRYNTDRQIFIDEIVRQDEVITSIGAAATNLNLNQSTYVHFEDISVLSVTAVGRHARYQELHHVVEPALTAITDIYPDTDSRWVEAAIAIVQNGMDFTLTEEEILETVEMNLLPHDYSFEDGRFIISTPLSFEESLPLYQAALEVRAQFFRMMESSSAVPDDTNDTLRIKLYGTRDDYRNFNNLLFGVNYPNSGGVYIETYGTFYTYQRTPSQSTYTLEELFRHEYTHYLQGRYIVPRGWGESPIYNNSRLVWFEEGMAQFFSASTRASNVKALSLIKDAIERHTVRQDLETVLSSSYSTGNPDAYYIYGAMFWTKLYYEDRDRFLQFVDLILNEDLDTFDDLVESYKSSTQENQEYLDFIDSTLLENDIWITPSTTGAIPSTIDPYDLDVIINEVQDIIPDIDIIEGRIEVEDQPRQFRITGLVTIDYDGSDDAEKNIRFGHELNRYLDQLEVSSFNNFEFTTAYHENVRTGSMSGYAADFHLYGPINDYCRPSEIESMEAEPFGDYVILYTPDDLPLAHQFRYRSLGATEWVTLDPSTSISDQIDGLEGIGGYEYQIRYECVADTWSPFSGSKTFYLCPEDLTYTQAIDQAVTIGAAHHLTVSSLIEATASARLSATQSIVLASDFEIQSGATLDVSNDDCRGRQ